MREILFRAKRLYNGEWIEGLLWKKKCNSNKLFLSCFSNEDDDDEFFVVDSETVGQYTGLTDKNGKKVFEGDIFKFPDEVWESCYTSCGTEYDSWEVENYGVVGFDEYSAKYDFVKYKYNENSVEADLHENGTLDFVEFLTGLEIIGNIHDNPELLKGGETDE